MSAPTHHRLRQRGFSLAEVMTAMAIFAVIFVAALLLYDRSNRVFSSSTSAAEMQQSTRVAFDKLVQDLRMAGFDYKRAGVPTSSFLARRASQAYVVGQIVVPDVANGHVYRCTTAGTTQATSPPWDAGTGTVTHDGTVYWTEAGVITAAFDQPDEQIEYAWHSAMTVRGNYNFDLPNDAHHYDHGRESDLESPQFPVVTTGNDEIVTYVLHSEASGSNNTDSVVLYADVNNAGTAPSRRTYPGGSPERQITIDNVDLSNSHPPYTLLRVTLDSQGNLVRTPLAENIRSLTFDYFQDSQGLVPLADTSGVSITDVGGNGRVDPASPDSVNFVDRLTRKNIRAVKVTLVGMNGEEDRAYTDPADSIAPHYRKMTLQTTIVPRNLGIVSQTQAPLQPPPAPTGVQVCYGYCGIPMVSWLPGDPSTYNTGSTGAESFVVAYDDDINGTFSNYYPAGTLTSYAVDMTQLGSDIATKTYYFKVGATNAAGTQFSSAIGPYSVRNSTKPNAPGSVTAVGSGGVSTPTVTLSWRTPSGNQTGTPSCSSGTTTITNVPGEVQGYRVYRSTSSGFTPAAGNMIHDVNQTGVVSDGAGTFSYADTTVGSCTPYYYKIQAVEWCTDPAQNTSGQATDAESGYSTQVTATVTANKASTPVGFMVDPSTTCTLAGCTPVTIKWGKVTTDTSGATINVDSYQIWRRVRHGTITGPYSNVATLVNQALVPSPIAWTEPATLQYQESNGDQDFYDYYVIAKFGCGDSDPTVTLTVPNPCDSGVTISSNGSGAGTAASPWIAPTNGTMILQMNQGASPYTAITGGLVSLDSGAPTTLSGSSTPPWSTSWADPGDGSTHTMTFTATTTCTQTLPSVYIEASPAGCHLQTVANDPTILTSSGSGPYEIDLTLKNLSSDAVTLNTLVITDAVQKKGHWNSLQLPSGTTMTTASPSNLPADGGNSGAVTYTKTFNLSAASSADKTIAAGQSKVFKLLLTKDSGGTAPAASNLSSAIVTMTTAAGGSTVFTCTVR